jgi:hypothetical protein
MDTILRTLIALFTIAVKNSPHFGEVLSRFNPTDENQGSTALDTHNEESIRNSVVVSGVRTTEGTWDHPEIMAPAQGIMLKIPSRVGVVELDQLDNDTVLQLVNRHEVSNDDLPELQPEVFVDDVPARTLTSEISTCIIGPNRDGEPIIYTIHGGEPKRPSGIPDVTAFSGRGIKVRDAKILGLTYTKVNFSETRPTVDGFLTVNESAETMVGDYQEAQKSGVLSTFNPTTYGFEYSTVNTVE